MGTLASVLRTAVGTGSTVPAAGPGSEVATGSVDTALATAPTRSRATGVLDPSGRSRVTRTCHETTLEAATCLFIEGNDLCHVFVLLKLC